MSTRLAFILDITVFFQRFGPNLLDTIYLVASEGTSTCWIEVFCPLVKVGFLQRDEDTASSLYLTLIDQLYIPKRSHLGICV